MATGDTLAGKIDVVLEETNGDTTRVAGPFSSGDVDIQASLTPSELIYLNTMNTDRIDAPLQARERAAPNARFKENEVLKVRHLANAAGTHDYDFDAYAIGVLRQTNRGKIDPDELNVQDQELSANVTLSTTSYVTIFEYTVPDGEEVRLAGSLEASAVST